MEKSDDTAPAKAARKSTGAPSDLAGETTPTPLPAEEPPHAPAAPSAPAVALPPVVRGVRAWASEKGIADFFLEGAIGCERAAGRWALHVEPTVTEAEFVAAVEAFTNVSLGGHAAALPTKG